MILCLVTIVIVWWIYLEGCQIRIIPHTASVAGGININNFMYLHCTFQPVHSEGDQP